jgi:hypothetical protein
MSAFSRGLFFRPQCTFKPPRNLYIFFQVKNPQQPRSFSAAAILRAVKQQQPKSTIKQVNSSTPKPPPLAKVANVLKKPVYQTYASKLAEKGHPTLIYVAPSHTSFLIASYSAGSFCFAYATYHFWFSSVHEHPGLAPWVPIAFAGVCLCMSVLGTWLMLSPSRLIRTITAVPKAASKAATAGKALSKNGQGEIELEIELRKMLPIPFPKPRTLRMKPEDVIIRSPLVGPPPKRITPAERHSMMLQEKAERKKALEYEQTHILSSPFRHMSRLLFSFFRATARVWTREGFAKVKANGQTYKLDVTGGWALDGGKALDRLVTLKREL